MEKTLLEPHHKCRQRGIMHWAWGRGTIHTGDSGWLWGTQGGLKKNYPIQVNVMASNCPHSSSNKALPYWEYCISLFFFSQLFVSPSQTNQSLLEGLMLKLKLQYFGYFGKELSLWKRPWCWERLKAGGEWDDRGWDGWMASLTQRTWVWASSRSWWWTGKPGILQPMGSQRVKHDWATELNWMDVEVGSTIPIFLRVLIINGCWMLSKTFSASIEINYHMVFFFQFVNMEYHTDWFVYV